MSKNFRILVLDGQSSAALAFVRSLGRAGHWVAVGATYGSFPASFKSKYCRRTLSYPNPLNDIKKFNKILLEFAQEFHIDLITPMTDATVWPLAKHKQYYANISTIAASSFESIELVSNKYSTLQLAEKVGIPAPVTLLLSSLSDLNKQIIRQFPVVIKDNFSIKWKDDFGVPGSVSYAYTLEELKKIIAKRLDKLPEVMVQHFTPGTGIGFSCFSDGQQTFLPFQWERLREKDPRGSGSSARRSITVDPDVLEYSEALVKHSGYNGILMVEFKRNKKTGKLNLMEINGRPWGSIQLPIHCGINYPLHLANWFLKGELPPKVLSYKKNITCRWFVADLIHLENLKKGAPPGWPTAYPKFLPNLFKVLIPWYPGLRYDHFSLDDPKPGIENLWKWLTSKF